VSDVRHLAAEASRALRELEDAPLLTAEQRKLDRDGLILQKLNYKACLIRIRFPDRTVLQGCFKPIDTVAQVKLFVKEHLQDPDLQFYLCEYSLELWYHVFLELLTGLRLSFFMDPRGVESNYHGSSHFP